MMKRLEGRNLAHPGCLIGVTLGLIIGIVLAGILASAFNVAFNTVLLIWLGITVGLGMIGWIWGAYLTTRQQIAAMRASASETLESSERNTHEGQNITMPGEQ